MKKLNNSFPKPNIPLANTLISTYTTQYLLIHKNSQSPSSIKLFEVTTGHFPFEAKMGMFESEPDQIPF